MRMPKTSGPSTRASQGSARRGSRSCMACMALKEQKTLAWATMAGEMRIGKRKPGGLSRRLGSAGLACYLWTVGKTAPAYLFCMNFAISGVIRAS